MKHDERSLLTAIQAARRREPFPYVRAIVEQLGLNEKRAAYILAKWGDKGWYEWGVNLFAGWLTDQAPAALIPDR